MANAIQAQEYPRSTIHHDRDFEFSFERRADYDSKAYEDSELTVYVDEWNMQCGDNCYVVDMIMPVTAPIYARWLLGSIKRQAGSVIWTYRADCRVRAGFEGLAYLVGYYGQTYLVFQTKGKEPKVAHSVPLCDLLLQQEPKRSIVEMAEFKAGVANMLKLGVHYTNKELAELSKKLRHQRKSENRKQKGGRKTLSLHTSKQRVASY